MSEVLRTLAVLAEPPAREHSRLWRLLGVSDPPDSAAYTDLFLMQLYPYASVYLGDEGKLGGEVRDRVAGFLGALGAAGSAEPDHLASLLAGYAALIEAHAAATTSVHREAWGRARAAMLWEHILSWAPRYLMEIPRHTTGAYVTWAGLLSEALRREACLLAPPEQLPLHLREAPALPDPRADNGDLLDGLLCPVRTGVVVTRTLLAKVARQERLPLRLAERRYVLSNLLDQDARATLSWLEREASATAARVRDALRWSGPVGTAWAARAQRTGRLLGALAAEASDGVAGAPRRVRKTTAGATAGH